MKKNFLKVKKWALHYSALQKFKISDKTNFCGTQVMSKYDQLYKYLVPKWLKSTVSDINLYIFYIILVPCIFFGFLEYSMKHHISSQKNHFISCHARKLNINILIGMRVIKGVYQLSRLCRHLVTLHHFNAVCDA